ncbi:hypothetical protein KIH74_23230 [Kineosporia sp. J2-2]|uniref:Uncharacterized protein n=1 Tax=Kineosporia corallincola TaxID=2835133 RepID=A0ABS5TL91_9ACTN|nr:hypothetical protein [Kineosporia corallincola]MBT0771874.1 hypothetical protein [Kineosporia corallincola]
MSVADVIQAFGWIPVIWLLTVHLLIRFGRLPRHGTAVRAAGFVAAVTIVAAALATRMWPIAVLGFLFMRTELFGHRHHDEREAHRLHDLMERFRHHQEQEAAAPARIPGARVPLHENEEVLEDVRIHHGHDGVGPSSGRHPEYTVPGMTAAPATTLRARTKDDPDFVPAAVGLRHPHHRPEPEHPTGGMRFLNSAKRFTDLLLKLEIIAVVVIALVLFGIWAEGQRRDFTRNSDSTICEISFSC